MSIEEIVRIDQRIMMLEEAKRDMVNQFVAEHHPHKVGVEIECTDLLHLGKSMKVTQSYVNLHRQPGGVIYAYAFRCKGLILTKSGLLGAYKGEWSGQTIPVIPLETRAADKPETMTATKVRDRLAEGRERLAKEIAQDDDGK